MFKTIDLKQYLSTDLQLGPYSYPGSNSIVCNDGLQKGATEIVLPHQMKRADTPPPSFRPVVVEIPARSGSKRIKDKNIKLLNGIPLIAYTILVAKNIQGVDRVIVNTDSEYYADIAKEYGAEVPFIRPKELATDTVPMAMLLQHFREFLVREYDNWYEPGKPFVKHIQLFPTTPFRNVKIMAEYLKHMHRHSLVLTAVRGDVEKEKIVLSNHEPGLFANSINRRANRYFYYKIISSFMGKTIPIPSTTRKVFLLDNIFEMIDIDTEEDFQMAEEVIRNQMYDFGINV